MGLFNEFEGVQLKVGELMLAHYAIGDRVVDDCGIPDGVYVGYEGVIVVVGGIFVARFQEIYDKWGGPLVIALHGEVDDAIARFEKEREKK